MKMFFRRWRRPLCTAAFGGAIVAADVYLSAYPLGRVILLVVPLVTAIVVMVCLQYFGVWLPFRVSTEYSVASDDADGGVLKHKHTISANRPITADEEQTLNEPLRPLLAEANKALAVMEVKNDALEEAAGITYQDTLDTQQHGMLEIGELMRAARKNAEVVEAVMEKLVGITKTRPLRPPLDAYGNTEAEVKAAVRDAKLPPLWRKCEGVGCAGDEDEKEVRLVRDWQYTANEPRKDVYMCKVCRELENVDPTKTEPNGVSKQRTDSDSVDDASITSIDSENLEAAGH